MVGKVNCLAAECGAYSLKLGNVLSQLNMCNLYFAVGYSGHFMAIQGKSVAFTKTFQRALKKSALLLKSFDSPFRDFNYF